ncbi:MAG: glycosyltransferase family 4 protein [Verrucomicrobia bacterium]|nr:glycosyltransferase family 4 protein [Verrucomicrobiota bacterium]
MPELKLAVTGFVSSASGSMAGANGLLLQAMLARGCRVDFFSKSSFVDPRPLLGDHPLFRFHETVNPIADGLRRKVEKLPLLGPLACRLDSATYHRALLKSVSAAHSREPFDRFLWLGDYARGRVPGLPNIAFAQGPPGTDARAVLRHFKQIKNVSGTAAAWKWLCLARMRLSPAGLPPFPFSDHVIVGSRQSKTSLVSLFGFEEAKVSALPYPVDLEAFHPGTRQRTPGELRCLWLGRIVPRKRLDLFLSAAELAVSRGWDIRLTIAGDVRMVCGYERLIEDFPYPERLVWRKHVPRDGVPELIRAHDVLIQPSEEEDFGSSVAEAQACGIPVIVGSTNGNRDYLSSRDIVLGAESAEALCDAIGEVFMRREGPEAVTISRLAAEKYFEIGDVADQMMGILESRRA